MDTGMLWFDDSDQDLEKKVERAVRYYVEKYERAPNLCVVHPSMLNSGDTVVGEVEVRPATAIMPHHYWIGVHEGLDGSAKPSKRKAA